MQLVKGLVLDNLQELISHVSSRSKWEKYAIPLRHLPDVPNKMLAPVLTVLNG